MPRYYFDLYNGDGETSDHDGQTLTPAGVRTEAIKTLADVAHDELPGGDRQIIAVKVRDETGRYVFEASLALVAGWTE